jgi:chaperone BCS1
MDSTPVSQFAIMNALRTGNLVIDTLLAIILPLILTTIFKLFSDYSSKIIDWINFYISKEFNRKIIYTEDSSNNVRNNILQKALIMYIAENYKINDVSANFELRTIKEENERRSFCDDSVIIGNSVQQLKKYKIYTSPPENLWILINNIYININNSYFSFDNKKIKKTIITLKCKKSNGNSLLNEFINNSYEWYIKQMSLIEDKYRYMYIPILNRESRKIKYKKYILDNNKTFDSLFFQQKEHIINIIDNFINKKGRYEIKGSPHKLGVMLYGVPGSGKTSIIKAIASYTNRHIINVPLAKIETNQELINIMNDQSFSCLDEEFPEKIPFSNCIFVFEDIDCEVDIIKSRKINNNNNKNCSNKQPIDKLNLAGVLNVLDGIYDSPSRIVIMTTNHIEVLDDALLRCGRIDFKYSLNHMILEDIINLIQYYYKIKLNKSQLKLLKKLNSPEIPPEKLTDLSCSNTTKITPAVLEQMCAEFSTVDTLIEKIII